MKKLINDPQNVVEEMLRGFAKANPKVSYVGGQGVIFRSPTGTKVGLVSGGGAGHEPAHAGFVGRGMLDVAIAGNVFASPGPAAILEGIRRANTGQGVLLIIKNYSGDVMNFQMAAELAALENIDVDWVIVKDDVAVPDSTYSTGRRGIAGTVFVHKVAGAKAEQGGSLEAVKRVAQKCIQNLRSMGMATSPCILPALDKAGFSLEDSEMEIGMGIHGEPGVKRQPLATAAEVAQILLDKIWVDYDYAQSEVAVLVNGLGGTPLMELYIMYNEVDRILAEKGVKIHKAFVGNYMTSLDMSGCSLSMLKLDGELKELLEQPCDAPAFHV